MRQLEPATRAEKESVWEADLERIKRDANNRIEANGRGTYGIVDQKLDEDIEELDEDLSLDDD